MPGCESPRLQAGTSQWQPRLMQLSPASTPEGHRRPLAAVPPGEFPAQAPPAGPQKLVWSKDIGAQIQSKE